MGAIRTLLLALAGAGALAAPAAASEDDWPVLKGARLEGLRPWGAFAVYRADRSVTGVSLYLRGAEALARRVETREGVEATVTWATSKSCARLTPVLAELEALPAPRIEVPGVGRQPPAPAASANGDSYLLWAEDARFAAAPYPVQIEVRGEGGSPMAAWVETSLRRVAACWSPVQP
ncbi:hypothetical protein [Phenylobacterium sp.]|uniref:hypothetical protein n=1 Tax=Phenylobacterium sp. TaxID=1871053 RepID=UPI0025EA6FAD|nr:hypothetical protein [Phenylobacterium sp.]